VKELIFVLVAESSPAELFRKLSQLPGVQEYAGQDERRLTLRFAGGSSAQIVATTPVNAGTVLVQATGNEDHLRELSAHAREKGFGLNGAALWRGSEFVPTPDEATFYQALGLSYIPPELREGRGEVAAAGQEPLPRLLEAKDLKGFLHCHTRYSDGSASVEELARACQAAGYEYLGVTDHSQAAAYAGGLTPEDLARQGEEIDEVNSRLQGFRVLKGIEADILQDGRVDYDERVLAQLDFVIGCWLPWITPISRSLVILPAGCSSRVIRTRSTSMRLSRRRRPPVSRWRSMPIRTVWTSTGGSCARHARLERRFRSGQTRTTWLG
jgi:DNA polymerase (family 10)